MLMTEITLTEHQALEEFHEMLRECCDRRCPPRNMAAHYQRCRMILLSGEMRSSLPGFVTQCVSLVKFREFIHLYDPDTAVRLRFVDRSLENCLAHLPVPPRPRIFDLDDF